MTHVYYATGMPSRTAAWVLARVGKSDTGALAVIPRKSMNAAYTYVSGHRTQYAAHLAKERLEAAR